jgi:hypothetical protein
MKSFLILLAAMAALAALGVASLPALAQSAGPSPAAASPTPAPTPAANTGASASSVPLPGQPSGPALEKSLPLMPEPLPAGAGSPGPRARGRKSGKPNAAPGASPTNTFDVEQDIRLHIRIRQAETHVLNDPRTQADWVAAHETRTDPDRRAALTVYYNHLFDRMIKLDPTIADRVNARRQAVIIRMHYARLGDEPPSEDPFATPAPDTTGKNAPPSDGPAVP